MITEHADSLVILGATGELARQRAFPALAGLVAAGALDLPVIGVANTGWDRDAFRRYAADALRTAGIDPGHKDSRRLLDLLEYVDGDLTQEATWQAVAQALPARRRALFYLAVPPALFRPVAESLGRAGLAQHSRIMVEKPFGADLRSANRLNATVRSIFPPEAVYRVDHWLGLDPLENILVTRFANGVLEPLLTRDHVESVQITMADSSGVPEPGDRYDRTGAVRDVLQNHLLEVLATVLMDPPAGTGLPAVREERGRLIRALSPLSPLRTVFGQYEGYHDVAGVKPGSTVETFVATRLHADTWRWAGVPVLIRSGRCLPVTATEVYLRFRRPPQNVFGLHPLRANTLRLRIWPESTVTFTLNGRRPGPAMAAQVDEAVLAPAADEPLPPYEKLIAAAVHGQYWLFADERTVEAAWRVVDPVLHGGIPAHPYPKGTWGPGEAARLLLRGESWHDPAGTGEK